MRSFSVSSTARQVLWYVFNAATPVAVLSAVVLVPVLTGAACPSGASATPQVASSAGTQAAAGSPSPIRLSRLLGSAVSGPDRKPVGTVNDVLLDHDGKITAVTLDIGAFLGVHTRTVAVPIGRLRLVSGGEAAAGPPPGPLVASGALDDGSANLMDDLMSGNGRTWQVGPADHIEVGLTRNELASLPSDTAD